MPRTIAEIRAAVAEQHRQAAEGGRLPEWPSARVEPPLPSLGRQARNVAGAAVRAASAAVRGEPVLAPPALAEARLAVCRRAAGLPPDQVREGACDRYRPSDGRCSACGCRMSGVAGKARLMKEDCPLKRWPDGAPPP